MRLGIPTYVVDEVPIQKRDFAGGKATALFEELKQMGAVFVNHDSDILSVLNAGGKTNCLVHEPLGVPDDMKRRYRSLS